MIDYWRRMTAGEKNRVIILLTALIIAAYFLLQYPSSHERAFESEKLLNRKINRIETRFGKIPEPDASATQLERRLGELKTGLERTRTRLASLSPRFASLDSVSDLQRLRLEITQLSETSGINVLRLSKLNESKNQATAQETGELLRQETANRFGRPLLTLSAEGHYHALMRFLEGLQGLTFNVSVVRLDLKIDGDRSGKASAGMPVDAQKLKIALLLAL